MSDEFTRTPTGLVVKWQFHPVPTVWVEGSSDVWFYEPVLDGLRYRLEPFFGKENAEALIDGILAHDYPYVVVLDGDYDVLSLSRSKHRRIIVLRRYSFENYLWESLPIAKVCLRAAQNGEDPAPLEAEFKAFETDMETKLHRLIVLDIAARKMDPAPKVLPDKIDPLLSEPHKAKVCEHRVADLMQQKEGQIEVSLIESVNIMVGQFLTRGKLHYILRGHLALGLIRYFIWDNAAKVSLYKVRIDDGSLIQLLSDVIWRRPPTPDHLRMRKQLRKQVQLLFPLCQPTSAVGQ